MSDSLFKDDKNSALHDAGIGGLKSSDDLSRKADEAMRKMQREDQRPLQFEGSDGHESVNLFGQSDQLRAV